MSEFFPVINYRHQVYQTIAQAAQTQMGINVKQFQNTYLRDYYKTELRKLNEMPLKIDACKLNDITSVNVLSQSPRTSMNTFLYSFRTYSYFLFAHAVQNIAHCFL